MTALFSNLLLGLGVGGVIAALAIGVVVTHRASNVINFAHAAIGTYLALVYYEFRQTGEIVQPLLLPFVPARFHLLDRPTVSSAMIVTLVIAAIVGATTYWLIFRPLRTSPPLATRVTDPRTDPRTDSLTRARTSQGRSLTQNQGAAPVGGLPVSEHRPMGWMERLEGAPDEVIYRRRPERTTPGSVLPPALTPRSHGIFRHHASGLPPPPSERPPTR